jgi:hypothetical protein
MAQPYPERFMAAYPISRNLNNPQHDAPDLIIPMQDLGNQGGHSMSKYRWLASRRLAYHQNSSSKIHPALTSALIQG